MRIGDLVLYDQQRPSERVTWRAVVVAVRPGFVSIFVDAWARAVTVRDDRLRPVSFDEWRQPAAVGRQPIGGAS